MSKKKTPPSYTEPGGPRIVLTHSYTLSPFGPALKFVYKLNIATNSYWLYKLI